MLDLSTSDIVPLQRIRQGRMEDLCPTPMACRALQAVASTVECDDLKLIVISDHEASRVLMSCEGEL